MTSTLAQKIRAKKLGALIRDARKAAGKSLQECGTIIGVSNRRIGSFERGKSSPSLPELEGLAFFMEVPLDHFWGDSSRLNADQERLEKLNLNKTIPIRQRIIGTNLRQARLSAEMTMKDLGAEMGISATMLGIYERGEGAIPLPALETAVRILDVPLSEYHDQTGLVGQWFQQQQAVNQFLELSPELQSFVAKPVNIAYLELAMRLSGMSVEKLRAVAEGLLDITI
jgi:transcriptional regulator with XRE-family HTH domain